MIRFTQDIIVDDAKFKWLSPPSEPGYPWSIELRSGSDRIYLNMDEAQLFLLRAALNQKREETTPCPS